MALARSSMPMAIGQVQTMTCCASWMELTILILRKYHCLQFHGFAGMLSFCFCGNISLLVIQKGVVMCDKPANYRFTWPGNDESLICDGHVDKLRGVANAMGFHLQVTPLSESELKKGLNCNQKGV